MLVEARCHDCGSTTVLDPAAITLFASPSHLNVVKAIFECHHCHRKGTVAVDEKVASLLEARGARMVPNRAAGHPSGRPTRTGPPLTYDDLLTFHELLQEPDWFDRLLAAT